VKVQTSDDYIEKELAKSVTETELEALKKLNDKRDVNKDALNSFVRAILLYAGFIGTAISATSYIIATFVMINGLSSNLTIENQVLFSALGAVVGILISSLLRSQGIIYAKQNEEVKAIEKSYETEKNKKKTYKQLHTITWYMLWAFIRDVFIKGLTIAVSLYFIIRIFVDGSGDYGLLWLAISNIFLFISFGLVGLSKMYEKYIDKHIPAIIVRTAKLREEATAKEIEKKHIESLKNGFTPTEKEKENEEII
jgi:hypothetical protein